LFHNINQKCLKQDKNERLGRHPEDVKQIITHPWFKDFDFDALLKKQVISQPYN